ncbi:MAG TPA: DUF222 domain-containing protein [Marmoricola sp.]|nr:DUF222 domain-containing protein [Marmoricola sp.]
MTTFTALRATDRISDPAAGLAAALLGCLEKLGRLDVGALDAAAKADLLTFYGRAEARLAALRLDLLAAAENAQVAKATGAATTVQWAANIANADHAEASRQVALAIGIQHRSGTRDALAAGVITPAHAAVIIRADQDLPPGVTREDRDRVEAALVRRAQDLSPAALRRAARRALAEIEPDPVVVDAHEDDLLRAEEQSARARTRLTFHDNGDGTVTGHFTVPVMQGHLLRKIIETITAPRRGRLGASTAQAGDPTGHGTGHGTEHPTGPRTDWDKARGLALVELIEHLPTDHLHPKTAATLVVTISEDTLRGALQAAHLDTGAELSAGEARRLVCNSRLQPAVLPGALHKALGGPSLPLDLGRTARLFSQAQRTALGLVRTTCAAQGCDRSHAWSELHHQDPWSHGGTTDLAQAISLCHFHHQRIHDHDYDHHYEPDGSVTFTRRT